MELTPQALHAVEFREAKRRGYNTRDVDDFIERVAAGVGQLHERVREAQARADAADARLADMQRELEEARRRPMSPEAAETDETLRRTLVLAQRTADATIKEAKEEANRVLSEAREESARTRAEAEADARRGAESARVAAEAEVESLLATRDQLARDHEVLHKRLGDQRANIRSGINELQRLLDDPSALRQVPAPTLAEVDAPAHAAPAAAAAEGNGDGAAGDADNGHEPAEADSPFAPGEPVASLQEPAPDLGPPTQPVPFGLTGDGRGPWQPSDLRPGADDPLGPLPPPPPGPPDGGPAPSAGPTDPADRPSEWGKAVFDPDAAEGGDRARFGRRR
jgi:DivIVA domain-containing protein